MILGSSSDPIATYARQSTRLILAQFRALPASARAQFMRETLNAIDRALWPTVQSRAQRLRRAGMPAEAAFEQALRGALADGLLRRAQREMAQSPEPLSGAWDWIKGKATSAAHAVQSTVSRVASTVARGTQQLACKAVNNQGFNTVLAAGTATVAGYYTAGAGAPLAYAATNKATGALRDKCNPPPPPPPAAPVMPPLAAKPRGIAPPPKLPVAPPPKAGGNTALLVGLGVLGVVLLARK